MLKNALFIFFLAIIILLCFLPSYSKMQDMEKKNWEYQREIEALKEKNAKLEEERKLLEEDPVYLEKVAREKMGLIKEGEVVYKITPAELE